MLISCCWLFLTLFLFSLENHWFMFFTTTQSPDLLLLFLILYAMDEGQKKGALYGLGIGTLLDVVTFSYFGWHILTRTCIGFLIGYNRRNMFTNQLLTYEVVVGMVTLLLQVGRGLFLCAALGRWMPFFPLAAAAAKCLFWNLLCGPILWTLYRRAKPRVKRRLDYHYHV